MGDSGSALSAANSNGSPSYTVDARVIRFRQELRSNTINLTDVSKLAYEGVPDKYGLRPLVWKVSSGLLNYVPAGCLSRTVRLPVYKFCWYRECSMFTCELQLLLAYLPVDTATWPALLTKKRQDYVAFCEVWSNNVSIYPSFLKSYEH